MWVFCVFFLTWGDPDIFTLNHDIRTFELHRKGGRVHLPEVMRRCFAICTKYIMFPPPKTDTLGELLSSTPQTYTGYCQLLMELTVFLKRSSSASTLMHPFSVCLQRVNRIINEVLTGPYGGKLVCVCVYRRTLISLTWAQK